MRERETGKEVDGRKEMEGAIQKKREGGRHTEGEREKERETNGGLIIEKQA